MKTIVHWVPAAFCAFLSGFAIIWPNAEWWRPAFFAFLPMCFFFVGNVTFQMHRELQTLRTQLAEARGNSVVNSE